MSTIMDSLVADVLACYPQPGPNAVVESITDCGGFSGARVWRVRAGVNEYCLRAWPPGDPTAARLQTLHDWLHAANARLDFVPQVFSDRAADTWVERAGCLWELTTWMPGRADYAQAPTPKKLAAAFSSLARLHQVWAQFTPGIGICPAVERRLEQANAWIMLIRSGWRPVIAADDPLQSLWQRAWSALARDIGEVPQRLEPWRRRKVALQPCLCDIYRDHVFFAGEKLTALIDFGAAKIDNPAVDIARLRGSMAADDATARSQALAAYAGVRPLTLAEEDLITVLDDTGLILGVGAWLRWIYREGKVITNSQAAEAKLTELVDRLEARP